MGPGEALQDFIIIFKLLNRGIRNIELTLVDPEYESLLSPVEKLEGSLLPERYYQSNQKEVYSIIRAISLLNRRYEDANICIYQYPSTEALKQDEKIVAPYDLIYAIDFEDYTKEEAKKDFHGTANYLKKDGQAILSIHNQIMVFDLLQNQNEYQEVNRIEYDPIKPEEGKYHQINDVSSFFL